MESSVQLLNLREEIKILQREKNCIEEKISLKMKQENEFSAKNLRWLKIINQKVGPEGSEKYSPKKLGAFPSTPKKKFLSLSVPSSPSPTISSIPNTVEPVLSEFKSACSSMKTMCPGLSVLANSAESASTSTSTSPVEGEMTVDDARLILGKYKTNKQFDEFEMVDDVTDDELLTELTETNKVKVGVSNKRESSDNDAANVKINYGHREDVDSNKSPMGNDMSVDGSNPETGISKISDDKKCGRSENDEADSMASNENERGKYHEIANVMI